MKNILLGLASMLLLASCSSDKVKYIYYESGNVAQILEYTGDQLNGKATRFFDDGQGQIWEQIDYVANLKHGKWLKWHKNGNMKAEDQYANNHKHGLSKEYWENGNIKIAMTYRNGKLHGKVTHYSETGKPVSITYFDNGQENENNIANQLAILN